MKLGRIVAIARRDLYSSLRDNLLISTLLAPLLLTVVLRLFVPGVGGTSLRFALTPEVGSDVAEALGRYGEVETLADLDRVRQRVLGFDDVAGIHRDDSGEVYVILEGNEAGDMPELAQMVLRSLRTGGEPLGVEVSTSDIGEGRSPLTTNGFIFMTMMALTIGGFVLGFNVIEEKESDTLRALTVTPMTRAELLAGRSAIGLVLPLVQMLLMLWIMGIGRVNLAMLCVVTLASSAGSVLLGYLIGALSSNQIAGIANAKVLFIAYLAPPVVALFWPSAPPALLYWAPTYWSYRAYSAILLGQANWAAVLQILAVILALSGLLLAVLGKRIGRGLRPT